MAKKHRHYLFWGLGVAAGGYVAYRFVYVPWAQRQAAAVPAGGSAGGMWSDMFPTVTTPGSALPGPSVMPVPTVASAVSAPVALPLPQITTAGPNTSIGPQYTGPVGACIRIKGSWSPQQCQQRLDALVQAFSNAQSWMASYPATLQQAKDLLTANQTALAGAQTAYNAATTAGDAAGAQAWLQAIQGHQADIANLSRAVSALPGQLAAFQAQASANDNDYFNLTQSHIG